MAGNTAIRAGPAGGYALARDCSRYLEPSFTVMSVRSIRTSTLHTTLSLLSSVNKVEGEQTAHMIYILETLEKRTDVLEIGKRISRSAEVS